MAGGSAVAPIEARSDASSNVTATTSLFERVGGGGLMKNLLKAILQTLEAAAEAKQMAMQAHRKWPALGE